LLPFSVAVTVTAWLPVTVPAVAVKLAVVAPAATVTEPGTGKEALLSEIATAEPPVGAAGDTVTVQLVLPPETTVEGEHCSLVTVMTVGVTVTVPVVEVLFSDAVTVTVWLPVTVPAVAVKVPVVAPAATVAEAGTLNAEVLLSERPTTAPPLGAGMASVMVHDEVPPDITLLGLH